MPSAPVSEDFKNLKEAQKVRECAYIPNVEWINPRYVFEVQHCCCVTVRCLYTYNTWHSLTFLSFAYVQKVLRSLEVAGEVLQELSKLGEADPALVKQQCEEYLQNLQVRLHSSPTDTDDFLH
jgi:hypothetical protein